MTKGNKTWLVFANSKICRHVDAIHDLGFINWENEHCNFYIGDTVYLFLSDERKIRFKMVVEAKNCKRKDKVYWNIPIKENLTYKFSFVSEYKGNLLDELIIKKHGFTNAKSIQMPNYKNKKLIDYINSVFDYVENNNTSLKKIEDRPMIIVDLFSGSYANKFTGHESLNQIKNPIDGRFYGYCPPHDNINITKLGASRNDSIIRGVTVVYVSKIIKTSDREVIAFCENATIHRNSKDGKSLDRVILDNGKKTYCTYSIESDTLVDLSNDTNKFKIHLADYNLWMFRMQRIYKGKYNNLDEKLFAYIQILVSDKTFFTYKKRADSICKIQPF